MSPIPIRGCQLSKKKNTRKSTIQEVSRDDQIAPKHNKTSVLELSYPSKGDLLNSDNFLNPRLSGLLSFPKNYIINAEILGTDATEKGRLRESGVHRCFAGRRGCICEISGFLRRSIFAGEMKVTTSTVAALFSKMALTGQRIAMVDMVLLVFPAFPHLP